MCCCTCWWDENVLVAYVIGFTAKQVLPVVHCDARKLCLTSINVINQCLNIFQGVQWYKTVSHLCLWEVVGTVCTSVTLLQDMMADVAYLGWNSISQLPSRTWLVFEEVWQRVTKWKMNILSHQYVSNNVMSLYFCLVTEVAYSSYLTTQWTVPVSWTYQLCSVTGQTMPFENE